MGCFWTNNFIIFGKLRNSLKPLIYFCLYLFSKFFFNFSFLVFGIDFVKLVFYVFWELKNSQKIWICLCLGPRDTFKEEEGYFDHSLRPFLGLFSISFPEVWVICYCIQVSTKWRRSIGKLGKTCCMWGGGVKNCHKISFVVYGCPLICKLPKFSNWPEKFYFQVFS